MRGVLQAMLVGALVLGLGTDDAFARKHRKGRNHDAIALTGIQSFDRVFARVGEIDRLLASAESELRTGKRNLNAALELKRGTPLTQGLAELQHRAKGKLGRAMDGRVPKLHATDAVPSNVSNAVDAVNGLAENLTASLADVQALAPEIERLVNDAQKLPDRLKAEFTRTNGAGLVDLVLKLPKTTKALTHDLEITTGLADRTTALTARMTEVLGVLNKEFPLVDRKHGAHHPAKRPRSVKPGSAKEKRQGYPTRDGGADRGRKGGYGDKR